MTLTGKTYTTGKTKELRIFQDGNYTNTVYARKITFLYNYAKENNIKIILKNH